MSNRAEAHRKKKISVTAAIFIALLLGTITGLVLHYWVPSSAFRDAFLIDGILNVVGNGFIRGMRMLVVPLVFCSLVCGAMSIGDTKTLGTIGVKVIGFYMLTTALAITLALGVANIINPGMGVDMSAITIQETTIAEAKPVADILLDIIPVNPFDALATGNMLQIIFFALLVGIILAKRGEKAKEMGNLFNQGNDIMMDMTMIVMKVAPIGVFCLIAKTFAAIGFDGFKPMLKYILGVYLALGIQCLVVYMRLLKGFTGLNPVKFVKKFLPVMGFAFSTASSNATIPLSIETLEHEVGVSKKISAFSVPLGATINMDGTAIMQGVAVVFIAQLFHIDLSMADYLTVIATATLASIGTAGAPGVGLITLSMVLTSVGLPIEGVGLIMGIDRIVDMARTVVNITGDAVCTTIVAKQDGSLNREVFDGKSTIVIEESVAV